jgi:hypothetical protein
LPITAIKFDSIWPLDIHLVRGKTSLGQSSADLRELLTVTRADNGETPTYLKYLETRSDVAILFTPLFKPTSVTTTAFKGFGITVAKKTGRVTVKGPAPAMAPSNFIIEASVTKNTGGVSPDKIPVAFMRVHVHQRVERVWFTPKRLTTRAAPGSELTKVNRAFTVRAATSLSTRSTHSSTFRTIWTTTVGFLFDQWLTNSDRRSS